MKPSPKKPPQKKAAAQPKKSPAPKKMPAAASKSHAKPLPVNSPVTVLHAFLDAGLRRDQPAMRACLSKNTLASGQFDGSSPEGVTFSLADAHTENGVTIVPMKAFPIAAPQGSPPAMEMQCVMIQEQGRWK